MNICMVGTGYVGLVTGACLADFGMNVVCVDKDGAKIASLQRGEIPIYEPGLEEVVARNARAGRLRFTTDLKTGIEDALAIFIAVGTPPKADGSPDLTFVRQVAEAVAQHMNGYKVVVTKSTVPTGTGRMIEQIIQEKNGRHEFSVVSNPEFLREGSAVADFLRPDRVIIGADDPRAIEVLKEIYSPLYLVETPFLITSVASAELIKYASNGFLAVKISFINEVARLCELMGADVHDVAKGMGLDRRIGAKFLHPGPGFGGSCFPKDTAAAADLARQHGYTFHIIEATMRVNAETKARMVEKIGEGGRASRRQDGGGAGTLLQAGDRRHPRIPGPRGGGGSAKRRRLGPGLRPGGDARGPGGLPGSPLCARRLRLRRGGALPCAGDRVERVPRARHGAAGPIAPREDDDRSAQRVRSAGDESGRLELHLRGAGMRLQDGSEP